MRLGEIPSQKRVPRKACHNVAYDVPTGVKIEIIGPGWIYLRYLLSPVIWQAGSLGLWKDISPYTCADYLIGSQDACRYLRIVIAAGRAGIKC